MKFTSLDLLRGIAAQPETALLDDPEREPTPVKPQTQLYMRSGPNGEWLPMGAKAETTQRIPIQRPSELIPPPFPPARPQPQVIRIHVEQRKTSPVLGALVFVTCALGSFLALSALIM